MPDPDLQLAAVRLHHLSMRYVGALAEVALGEKIGLIPNNRPGVHEMRDLIDLILLTRAEISGLAKILLDAGITTGEKLTAQFADEYAYLTKAKESQLGVEVSDEGLVYKKPDGKNN